MKEKLESILAFALLHDWGHNAHIRNHFVWVRDTTDKYKLWIPFNSLQELKKWAGY